MDNDQTSFEPQRLAFSYLRGNATSAHLTGDGLLVSLLCSTGLDRASRLADTKSLLLPLADLAWMPIFGLYWLVSTRERFNIDEIVKKFSNGEAEDAALGEWLRLHDFLIAQPMSGRSELLQKLISLSWPTFFQQHSQEAETLLTHMIELVWFRAPSDGGWQDLAETWKNSGQSWASESIERLRQRLAVQTRLTVPGKRYPLFSESAVDELRDHSVFAELWLMHLHGRSSRVCETAERLAPRSSADSHHWRIVGDFANIDGRFFANREQEDVFLARRRRLSVDTPLLIFNDKRRERINDLLAEIFRAQRGHIASRRWEALTLAMLHEISALRLWDYFMWLEAIRAKSEALLEIMQWSKEHPALAAHALILAVRGTGLRDPDEDWATRRTIDVLEFAPLEVVSELAEGLLAMYPRLKYSVAELLDDITDLLPLPVWPELASWTIVYASESAERRTNGFHAVPAKHWLWALASVSLESPIWATLKPEILRMVSFSQNWQHSETRGLLQRWFMHAPTSLAREVGEAMMAADIPTPDIGAREIRTGLLIFLETQHPELRGAFTKRLAAEPHPVGNSLRLARHLSFPDLAEREVSARESIIRQVDDTLKRAAPPLSKQALEMFALPEIELVKEWRLEDKPLLERLADAVISPTAFNEYLPWLLGAIRLMVARGPLQFANFVRLRVSPWIKVLPKGRSTFEMSGPFSTVHLRGTSDEDISYWIGRNLFELWRKLGTDAYDGWLEWSRAVLSSGETEPLQIVAWSGVIISMTSATEQANEALSLSETAILRLWTRTVEDESATRNLSVALNELAVYFAADNPESPDWRSENTRSSLEKAIALFERLLPHLARSPRSVLRSAVAELLSQISHRQFLSPALAEVLTKLAQDNRARVRIRALDRSRRG